MQLGAAGAGGVDGGRACAAIRAQDPVPVLGMPGLRADLLGGHALAADARGAGGPLRNVLRRLIAGELTEDEALAELRSIQLEELGGKAKLDLGRYMRRGIPEVVLATGKTPGDAGRLTVALAERQGQGLVSRMTAEHRTAVREAAADAQLTVVDYANSARVL